MTAPSDGWLSVEHGEVQIGGAPAPEETIRLALQAAVLTAHAQPSVELLDWFAAHRHEPLSWDRAHTAALVRLLRAHEPRSWLLLEKTGVLERALPEVAAAIRRRRADTTNVDPVGALRFRVAERLDDLAIESDLPSDDLMLAALVSDVCNEVPEPQPCWTSLLERLVPEPDRQRLFALISDARLLRFSADDPAGADQRDVLQLATQFGSAEHAHDVHQLALALDALTIWRRGLLDERRALIDEAFDNAELGSASGISLVAARRLAAQRIVDTEAGIERLRFAPVSYVLSHSPEELAARACLIDPLPAPGRVRVTVASHTEPGQWTIDVACQDRDGLLAHLTGVLTSRDLDVVDATVGTWPDGGVLDTFVVRATESPDAQQLGDDLERSLSTALRAPAGVGLCAVFNNEVLPWHTVCDVSGPDQPGALLAVSAAFAHADVVVHSARISTVDRVIRDRFTLSDRLGHKLDEESIERVRGALAADH